VSGWPARQRPRTDKLIEVERVFEVPARRLLEADFGNLLANELASRERYERVEERKKALKGANAVRPRRQRAGG
jgi:hypothetical protein